MIERQHGVGLAAAEVGLELHDRITTAAGKAPHGADEQRLQALGEIGAPEELDGVPVLVGPFSEMDLPEVGGELGLLVPPAGDVLVRGHHLSPRLQVARGRALDRRACALPLLAPHLLVEAEPKQLHLHLLDLIGLRGGNGGQQPFRRVERAVGVVAGEGLLVGPLVAVSRNSLTRLRSAGPAIRRKTSFQASHISFRSAAASHSVTGLAERLVARPRTASSRRPYPCRRSELPFDEGPRPALRSSSALPTRSWLVIAMAIPRIRFEQAGLLVASASRLRAPGA